MIGSSIISSFRWQVNIPRCPESENTTGRVSAYTLVKRSGFPADQLARFLEEAKRTGTFELYYIDLATGLRRGELLGLKWQDVDLQNGVIHIRRQVGRIDGKLQEAPLKTKNAYRNISIGADAVSILREKKWRDGGRSEYVFPSPTGGPMSPDSVLHMLHRVLERAGLPELRFHV